MLVIGLEDFFKMVNQKVSGRSFDYEYGQIYYLNDGDELTFYYGDAVWKYKCVIRYEDFITFYGDFDDFLKKYKPIQLLNIENDIRLKVIE